MSVVLRADPERHAMNVLLVDGVPSIHRYLGRQLYDQGVVMTAVDTVQTALAALEVRPFSVVIIDLVLPDGSGLEVLDAVRSSGSVAHVIIVSSSADPGDQVEARQRGADDYVLKPFLLRGLTARVLAVRRSTDPEADALLQVGPLTIDLRARLVRSGDRALDLTAKEFDLLAFLAARPGHVFSKAELLRAVWQSEPEWQQVATVTEHVRRLRAKIEPDARHPRILRTVRGSGYRLDLPEGEAPAGGSPFEPGTVIHVDGRIVHADKAAGELLGPTAEADLVGRQMFELVASTSRRAARERMAVTGPGPARRTELIDLERIDGTAMLVEVASEQTSWEGRPAGRVTLTHVPDLSARLRRLVTGVLSEVADAVIITDLHFHLRSWNQAAERLYGWREQEVLGRHVLDILQPRGDTDDDGALAATWENLEEVGRWKGDGRHLTRDGSVIDVLSCTTLIRDLSGEPILVAAVNRLRPSGTTAQEAAAIRDVDRIRTGLANDEFEVHYQPVVDLADGRVIAMEALVRWNHPERGLLGPASFIGAAERSGTIVELGSVVLEKACTQAAEWRRSGADIAIAVNLSARQLSHPALYDRISTVLALTGLEPDRLWLEVTETSLVEEVDRASAVLYRLADLGIGITIDDFGTGWASLTYLRSFPIHALKIDRSFVAGVGSNANDTAIARSILSLGAELGIVVVAEGIETPVQENALRTLGCTVGQGFLYGRPGPAHSAPTHRAGRATSRVRSSRPATSRAHSNSGGRPPVRPTVAPIASLFAAHVLAPGPLGPDATEPLVPCPEEAADEAALREHHENGLVTSFLRDLLRIDDPHDATRLLHEVIRQLGGTLVPSEQAGADTLPTDVSLGEGPPLLVAVRHPTPAGSQLEYLLAGLVQDARRAADLVQRSHAEIL